MSAINRLARSRNNPPIAAAAVPSATNVPCDFCNRRGHERNPVRFRIDMPGFFCAWCHDEHIAAKIARLGEWRDVTFTFPASRTAFTLSINGERIDVVAVA